MEQVKFYYFNILVSNKIVSVLPGNARKLSYKNNWTVFESEKCPMKVLSSAEVEAFENNGFIHYKEVFAKDDALALQNEIWAELETEFGINQFNSASWRTPPRTPTNAKFSKTNEKVINHKFRGIVNDLLGIGNWKEPKSWGGFLITFPDREQKEWKLAHKIWHWDYELYRLFELKGLLIFSFYSEVPPQGGGTLLVRGSHRVLEHYYHTLTPEQKTWKHGDQRKHFMKWHPWFAELSNPNSTVENRKAKFMDQLTEIEGVPVQVVELTGKPGDVVFCHPRIIHASAGINLNKYPRIMRVKFLW